MGDARNTPDVDPKFQRARTNNARWLRFVLDSSFRFFPDVPGQVPVISEELIRNALIFAQLSKLVGEFFDAATTVRDNTIVFSAQHTQKISRKARRIGFVG